MLSSRQEKEIICDNDFMLFQYQIYEGHIYLHAEFKKWGPSIFRRAYFILATFELQMKDKGYTQVRVIIPDNDEKLLKFEKMFGFEEVRRAGGCILLTKDI